MLERIKRTRAYVYIRAHTLLLFSLLVACVLSSLALHVPAVHRAATLLPCRMIVAESAREECVYAAIEKEMIAMDTGKALELFSDSLPLLTPDLKRDCHNLAHRVGDIAYYHVYVFNKDTLRISDSFASTICDYGFFHGFYEHLFQEHPSIPFMLSTCGALPTGPEQYKEDIRKTCFHGIGHGMLLAQTDLLSKKDWGNIHAFTDGPLLRCKELSGASPAELRRCPLGIFAELANWRMTGDYGFYVPADQSTRYEDCLSFSNPNRTFCIIPTALVSVLKYGVDNTLVSCTSIRDKTVFGVCVKGMIHGLFVNSATDADMHTGAALCSNSTVVSRGASNDCFDQLAWALTAYFPASEKGKYCTLFPETFRSRGCMVGDGDKLDV